MTKRAGCSIRDGVIRIYIALILAGALCPWGRLGLYQKSVPRIFNDGKSGRCVSLTTYPIL